MFKTVLLLGIIFTLAVAYDQQDSVLKLTQQDLDQALSQFPTLVVMFFSPTCGHCKVMAPIFVDVANTLSQNNSTVRLAMVDCASQKNVCNKYGIRSYPHVKMFRKNAEPEKYEYSRTKEAMMKWINEKAEEEVVPDQSSYQKNGNLYILTQSTFPKARQQFDFMMVKFYAPWCGHCKKLAPIYLNVANNMPNKKVKIAEVDCTEVKTVCKGHGIKGYPTVKFFIKGKNESIKYDKGRSEDTMMRWIQEQVKKFSSPELEQL